MAKPLIIVESPTKARTLRRFLGKRYQIKASMGHVRDLPKSQFGVDIEAGFQPKYITIRGKGKVLEELRKAARKASRVLLGTDPDREGEAISWHLADALGLEPERPCRVEFHEITDQAVRKALRKPRPIDRRLVDAQQARRILDRVVGYRISPLLWKTVKRGLSAGRVQSAALRLLCDRQREIDQFVPQEYWTIDGHFRLETGELEARYQGKDGSGPRIGSREEVDRLARLLPELEYRVARVERKTRRRVPPPPFTTSTLAQEAHRRLGFSTRKTMSVAQQLYEGVDLGEGGPVGLITYMRTDSTRLSSFFRQEVRDYLQRVKGEEYLGPAAGYRRARRAGVQDAHEAIRPTSVWRHPDQVERYLDRDQTRLYRLIWERAVASQMAPARYRQVTVELVGGEEHWFRATASRLEFAGFLAIHPDAENSENGAEGMSPMALEGIREGEPAQLVDIEVERHLTQPPPYYNEGTLVKTLEELGIGRPSTYAPTISTLLDRGYVRRERKRLVPTELGMIVTDLLKEHFPDIVDLQFTREMEEQLDRIEAGDADWRQVLWDFYRPFEAHLKEAEKNMKRVSLPVQETERICPQCGSRMVIREGRYGKFLACPRFPECRHTEPYAVSTGRTCPLCGDEVLERRTRRGTRFYGCARYPECSFRTWHEPAEGECPVCGAFVVARRRRGRVVLACARPGCGWREDEVSDGS